MSERFDVVIVGSGPVGAAFARRLAETTRMSILIVEAGRDLMGSGGTNIRNLAPADREIAYTEARDFALARTDGLAIPDAALKARPGTFLLRHDALSTPDDRGMPAAAMSSNLGGMGAHWTCACPRPGDSERIGFIPDTVMDAAFDIAESYLNVIQDGFPANATTSFVVEALRRDFGADRASDRQPQPMPLACRKGQGGPIWSGVDVVLGPLDSPEGRAARRTTLLTETLCRRVVMDDNRATGVELQNLTTGEISVVEAGFVVIAADALRTPQLLFASGVRPDALGRYLNDQPQVISLIELAPDRDWQGDSARETTDQRDNVTGVSWLPFKDGNFPFHAQLMQMDTSPIPLEPRADGNGRPVVGLGLFAAKEIRAEDRIVFDGEDALGLPRMRLEYGLTAADREKLRLASDIVAAVGASLGQVIGDPIVLPAGTSLHYQGTHRIGPSDDGTSVCDPASKVWGTSNLYLGGNGSIPTATACNPTLTAVALAVIAADDIASRHAG
ncbi:GMC oxidoreductase [Paracoccus aestuariivivens]|uniref:Pyranose oxidase n=1 Tax=Paracoccus aestuariivivens TaxID=1820333 RepID=A0A6L6JEP7_9RHOB|nr:GMC oxidoreductase [Paracoccus aestuariivivens]MTH79996.1 pyranose oxidase precursor [Paracoccus aestuariivivens]